jgi:hypothetical protein
MGVVDEKVTLPAQLSERPIIFQGEYIQILCVADPKSIRTVELL